MSGLHATATRRRETTFVNVEELAQRTGLPATWLRNEAEAGRLPVVRFGDRRRRLMVHAEAAERALLEMATSGRAKPEGKV